MSTSVANLPRQAVGADVSDGHEDPFTSTPPLSRPTHSHRYSSFDTQLFVHNSQTSSPSQAKRALEAHLAETDRRLQEASKLGTTLVQQRKNLGERLREVEKHQADEEIGPELRQKLVDIEKEYTEVSRESVRAFLGPKHADSGEASNAPFALDGRVSAYAMLYGLGLMRNRRIPLALPSSLEKLPIRRLRSMYRESSAISLPTERMILTLPPRLQRL